MVERKLKGVLVVLSIFVLIVFSTIVMFSDVVSATDDCTAFTQFLECRAPMAQCWNGIVSVRTCEIFCESRSPAVGEECCQWDSYTETCCVGTAITSGGTSDDYAAVCGAGATDQCASGVCCNTGANPNEFWDTNYPCGATDYCWSCEDPEIWIYSYETTCTGSSASCPSTGYSWVKEDSYYDDCGINGCSFQNFPGSGTCENLNGGSPGCDVGCSNDVGCTSVGLRRCYSGNEIQYEICGDWDLDFCLEWGSRTICSAPNDICTGAGICVECTTASHCSDGLSCTTDTCSSNNCVNTVTTTEASYACRAGYDDVWWRDSCGAWSHVKEPCAAGYSCDASDGTANCERDVTCGDGTIGGTEVCDTNGPNLDGENCQSRGYDGGILDCSSNCLSFDTSNCYDCGDGSVDGTEECDGGNLDGENCGSLGYDGGSLSCASNCQFYEANCCDDDPGCTSSSARQCSGDSYRTCDTSGSCNEWNSYVACGGSTPQCVNGYCEECEYDSHCDSDYDYYEYRCSGTSCSSNVERRYVSGNCNSGSCEPSYGSWSTYDNCGSNELCIGGTSTTTSSSSRYCSACDADESCISGSCQTCSINSVSWSPSSGLEEGDGVTISASTNSACNGKDLRVWIREDDAVDRTIDTLSTRTVSSSSASWSWTIDIDDDDDHYARAYLVADSSIRRDSSRVYISFPPPPVTCPDTVCDSGAGENCLTCPQDCGCGAQTCEGGSCVWPCTIDSVTWSTTSATNGDTVGINVQTSNCDGQTATFMVEEYDFGGNDAVSQTPSSDTVSSGSASSSWDAVAPDLGGETNPEYDVTAYVGSDSMESSNRLDVTALVTCPNGNIDGGETCDDDNSNNNDGCSSGCQIETGWECSGEPSNCWESCEDGTLDSGEDCDGSNLDGENCISQGFDGGTLDCYPLGHSSECEFDTSSCTSDNCGDGNIDSGEGCDDGDTNPGDGCDGSCQIEPDWECSGEPSSCWESCGDGNLDGTEECDDGNAQPDDGCTLCTVDPGYVCNGEPSVCIPPAGCSVSNTYWTQITIEEGSSAGLNIETANCNDGEEITIEIFEDDGAFGDDPVSANPSPVFTSGNTASTTWIAEFQQDTEIGQSNPPEYYFEATVTSTTSMDQSPFLEVTEMNICVGLTGCDSYLNQLDCETDACAIAESTIPNCGFEYDPVSRCYFANDCSCKWDGVQGICESFRDDGMECGTCGNGILDFGTEQCDDGNLDVGDGCDENCEFEIIPNPPCPEGTTLCDDGSCSLNCWVTDAGSSNCNYDDICDSGATPEEGEGCTCRDCDGEEDRCEAGLLCSLIDSACCESTSDGVCHPYCGYIDPDCAGQDVCGNGFRGFGEECDDGNTVSNDGCSNICEYEIFPGPPCPEGTMLCNDGTCSLNCDATDDGHDTSCQNSSCCEAGLEYNVQDNACCNFVTDGYCHPYCALSDPDCAVGIFGGIDGIGSCAYTKNSNDDCADGVLRRDYTATWTWDETNVFYENPGSNDYVEDIYTAGVWHYDPMDLSGFRRSDRCSNISDELICPAQIQLPAFGKVQLIISILLIAIVYTIVVFRRRE